MAFTPNDKPYYARGPLPVGPVAVPTTAKTVFNNDTNTAVLLPALPDNRQAVTALSVEVTANVTSGKLMLYVINGAGVAFQVASIAHGPLSPTTTATATKITFLIPAAEPILVPEGCSLAIATAVAQPAGSLIASGPGRLL